MSSIKWLSCVVCMAGSVAAAVAGDYRPPPFEGRTGEIQFENDSLYSVTVTLWHPTNGQRFACWKVEGGGNVTLAYHGKPVVVGDDWGVQIGNSRIRPLSQFAVWDRNQRAFEASIDLFHRR